MFLRKKENKPAPSKVQAPPRGKTKERVVFQKETVMEEALPKQNNTFVKTAAKKQYSIKTLQRQIESLLAAWLPAKKKHKKSRVIKKKASTQQKTEDILKKYEVDFQLALVPLILLAILSILMQLNNYYIEIIAENKVPKVESVGSIEPFPLTENIIPPDISAKAAVVLDSDSQVFLLNKNADLRFSLASTTKIMTALTALDHFKEEDILTVKSSGIQGSVLGLQPGEKLKFQDLLYAMLLPSANDAAVVIADNYPGGQEVFIKKMNEKALLLHLTDTHFADSSGLNDDENFSTAKDLARLGSYAMKNPTFAKIVGTQYKTIHNTYFSKQYGLSNLNKLLGTNGVNGIKTGTTEAAGEVLVTSTVVNDHTFIIVVMNSRDRFADTKVLINFIKEKVQYYVPPLPN